jgi:DNA replication protein DnaC
MSEHHLSTRTEPTPTWICHKCKDEYGYIIVRDGIEYYVECECYLPIKQEKLFQASKITPNFRLKTFGVWNVAYLEENVRIAHTGALNYVSHFNRIRNTRRNSIALLGQSGCGKTHLLMAIANRLMERGIPLLYFPFVEGFNELKADLDNLETRISKMQKVDVLFIDDLFKGRTSPTPFQIEQMFAVVNYRYMNHLPLLISSERSNHDLLEIDEALGSRIYEMTRDFNTELRGKKLNYRLRGDDDEIN